MVLGDGARILAGGFDGFEEAVHLVEVFLVSRLYAMTEDNCKGCKRREKDCPTVSLSIQEGDEKGTRGS